ncbi:MAG: Orotate phosphoribosyltransferase, partial [uncultured Sphingomonadaceae bacterium]
DDHVRRRNIIRVPRGGRVARRAFHPVVRAALPRLPAEDARVRGPGAHRAPVRRAGGAHPRALRPCRPRRLPRDRRDHPGLRDRPRARLPRGVRGARGRRVPAPPRVRDPGRRALRDRRGHRHHGSVGPGMRGRAARAPRRARRRGVHRRPVERPGGHQRPARRPVHARCPRLPRGRAAARTRGDPRDQAGQPGPAQM